MMNVAKTKIAAYLLAIFLIGCVAGGFAASAFFNKRPGPPGLSDLSERQMGRMITELSLTEEQVARIEPIVKEVVEQIRTVRRDSMAEFARLYGEMTERVETELTPEQKEVFRQIQNERKQRAERMLKQHRQDGEGQGGGRRQGGGWGAAHDGPRPERPPPGEEPPPPPPGEEPPPPEGS